MNAILEIPMTVATIHALSLFVLAACLFGLVIGVVLTSRNGRALHAMDSMNHWISLRRALKPMMVPHFVGSPARPPLLLGVFVLLAAAVSAYVLQGIGAEAFREMLFSPASGILITALSESIRWLLLIGNVLCVVAGALMMGSPAAWARLEQRADRWVSLRRATLPLDRMHREFDGWVLAHPTVSGIALIIVSLGLAVTSYVSWSW